MPNKHYFSGVDRTPFFKFWVVPLTNINKCVLRPTFVNDSVNDKTQNLKKLVEEPHETAPTLENGQCQIKQV